MEIRITRTTPVYRSPDNTGVFIQWVLDNPPADTDIKITLYRSGSPEGPFELVADNLSSFHYFDANRQTPDPEVAGATRENLNFLSLHRLVYYKTVAVTGTGKVAEDVAPMGDDLPKRQMLLRRKMHRDILVGFKFNGVPLAVLKRKHWGMRATKDFDPLTKKVLFSKSEVNYGTGFEGGYFDPVLIQGRLSVQNIQSQITPQGTADISQKQLTLLDYPILEPNDIIVELKNNRRYIVKHVTRTELRTVPVHQRALLSELARDSVEYRIAVNSEHSPIIY